MILSLDKDPNTDADNNDMLKAAGCLLAAVQKATTKGRERRKKKIKKTEEYMGNRMAFDEMSIRSL